MRPIPLLPESLPDSNINMIILSRNSCMDWIGKGFNKRPRTFYENQGKTEIQFQNIQKNHEKTAPFQAFLFERSVLVAILATFHKTTLSPPGRWTAARPLSWRVLPPRHSPCCLQHSHPSTPHASRPMLDPHHEPTTTAIISESSKKLTGKWWKQETGTNTR